MLILVDLEHDPKHWLSEAATAADRSDDRGAPAFGGRYSSQPIGRVWAVVEHPKERFSCEPS